jgi:hypothetical protein
MIDDFIIVLIYLVLLYRAIKVFVEAFIPKCEKVNTIINTEKKNDHLPYSATDNTLAINISVE